LTKGQCSSTSPPEGREVRGHSKKPTGRQETRGRCALERPLLIPLASLIAGLCTADFLGATPPAWSLAALLITTLIASLVRGRLPFLLSLALLFFVWGGISLEPFLRPPAGIAACATEKPVLIEGVLDQRPEGIAAGGERLFLRELYLHREKGGAFVAGRLLLRVKEGRAQLCTGDRILFSSKLRLPRLLGLPGEGDYPRQLAYQGVFATAFVKDTGELVLLRSGSGWRHGMDQLAAALGRFIMKSSPGMEGGVLKALLIGDSADVPVDLNDAYARSGVNHILSISGFHVGIIFLCAFQALFLAACCCEPLALRFNLRRALLLAVLPVVVFYLFLSGAQAATLRSVLMIAAVVLALYVKRELDPVNCIMLAAGAILFTAPETLFNLSFQLSFLAIWGLVVLAPPLSAPLSRVKGAAGWFLLLLAASAAAILATLVPVAYYFQRVSFIGLLANLVIVPLMGYGAVVAGFASLPLSFVAPESARILLQFAACLVRVSDAVILFLARAPVWSAYRPTRLDLLFAILILAAVTFVRPRKAARALALLLLFALVLRAIPGPGPETGALRVTFLSVGQGDAALVRLPDGKLMLVDGGGNHGDDELRVGRRLLAPALHALGVDRVDYLVLSHEHPDHLQGVLWVAANLDVGEFWESGITSGVREYQELRWVLAARGVPVHSLSAVFPAFAAGGALVEPLWPLAPGAGFTGDANDTSLVFRLRYGNGAVLFTGDLGSEQEEELIARGVPLGATLLKVGHHGSRFSSSAPFLAAVHPKAAVISAGFANSFHLPAPSTVAHLQERGIRVYRTDLDGSVQAVCTPEGTLLMTTPWGHFN
jgi:competence protein ComEC